ncbi:DMT family transporter [Martelella sp. HB161492]|uniref:DMT family transporter n=1 Tax=Martelella sp. HB161492 TaxID=2720726 RepID=UPI001590A4A9|nr:DMT family transporter [Martelella sp. HB161492]
METYVFAAVLLAALLHAGWNSVVKVGLDRFSTILLLALVQAAIALPILPFVEKPALASWGFIAAAALLHTGYKLFLIRAYAFSDLSQAYPLARGTAPLIVTLVSLTCLGVVLSPAALMAIAVISAGILLMTLKGARENRMDRRAVFYALGTAGFTASYTLVDGTGARIAGTATGFILAMVIVDALIMAVVAVCIKGRRVFSAVLPAWKTGIAAGAMSLGAYWIVVWAFTVAPIALVAALRETSILFATLIAAFLLNEKVNRWRWLSALLIAAGVVVMKV